MTGHSIDAYGALARQAPDPLVQAGRYPFQADAERYILDDILPKLLPEPQHRLLDIGAGAGALAIPLLFFVREVVAIDHPDIVQYLSARCKDRRLSVISGAFPETPVTGEFDRIVAYSVAQYMSDYEAIETFVLAAAAKLAPGGRLLIGDIPNSDRKARLEASAIAPEVGRQWQQAKAGVTVQATAQSSISDHMAGVRMNGSLTDEQILGLVLAFRKAGYNAMIVEQDPRLPFGLTREDIVVSRF